jgi:isopentenyldiphosphate isomerase
MVRRLGTLSRMKKHTRKVLFIALCTYWDISAAGHVSADETSVEAAQKETREELGLDLPESDFEKLFTIEEHVTLNEGTYIANEFQDVYLVQKDVDEEKLSLQIEEVQAVRWIDIEEFKEWIQGKGEPLVPHLEEHTRLLKLI